MARTRIGASSIAAMLPCPESIALAQAGETFAMATATTVARLLHATDASETLLAVTLE